MHSSSPLATSSLASTTPRLSVIIITKNEAALIGPCLQSVAFADEVVVLDSGSTDATCDIARSMGARVALSADWPGFGVQKNRALDLARGTWVFSLDADERVPPELAAEVLAAVNADHPRHSIYEMPRSSQFCGAYMRHSGWRPDYVTRLWLRGVARFSSSTVHERVEHDKTQPVGRMAHSLRHLSYSDLSQALDKMQSYSSARAHDQLAQGKRGGLGAAIGHGLWTFVRTYLLRLGVLDGRRGFILAVYNAETAYYRYLKMCPDFNHPRGFEP
jgi:glycosyltransferase involved in cell wall biosynthesis